MSNTRRVLLMLIALIAFLMPSANGAQAVAWHSPNGYLWTIGLVCQDGVRIIGMAPNADLNADGRPELAEVVLRFSAYVTSAAGTDEPQKAPESDPVRTYAELGSSNVDVSYHATALQWTDDEQNTSGSTLLYGSATITWDVLPVGRSVAVQRWESSEIFIGNVTGCRL